MPDQITAVVTGSRARAKILAGVNKVYDAVRLTLGPQGRNALLPRGWNRGPRITNDGITVAENARLLADPHERLAAEAFVEASKRTNELAGDGTTGTAVIAGHLINRIFGQLSEEDIPTVEVAGQERTGHKGVRTLRKEMKDAKDVVIAQIRKRAAKIETLEELERIATISIGIEDEGIAKTVAGMVWEIARDADGEFVDNFIDVTDGFKGEIETEIIRGMRYPAKVPHRAFLTNPSRFEMVAEDVPVLITNHKLDDVYAFVEVLNRLKLTKAAIFAPDFSNTVLTSIMKSNKDAGCAIYPVKCPALRTEQLEDLAVYTGAQLVNKDLGRKLSTVVQEDLGFAEKIVVKDTENKDDAILIGGKGEKVKRGDDTLISERQRILKEQMAEAKNDLSKMQLERRIANLSAAVGIIRVGQSTTGEGLFLKLKIEDGVFACRAALQEGYVRGGGLCLKEIAEEIPENILTESLKAPYDQIQKNAGGKLDIGEDVIDPAKVIRLAVEHGVSIAATMITTDICIPELREKSPAEGYQAVADAIKQIAYWQARQHGMIKENEDYAEVMRNQQFEEAMLTDKG